MNPTTDDAPDLLGAALAAADAGAAVLRRGFLGPPPNVRAKQAGDYVTNLDEESESVIRDRLSAAAEDIPVLGEEGGGDPGPRYWAVDPLDGTTNFILGLPVFAVSIALVEHGVPTIGAVVAPALRMRFAAARGHGARLGRRRLAVSARPPERAIVATGFLPRTPEYQAREFAVAGRVLDWGEDLRRTGSAALDLCWTAAGALDGYFELGLGVWDVAAGALMVEEAGGVVTDWEGGAGFLGGHIVAGSPPTHARLLASVTETERLPG